MVDRNRTYFQGAEGTKVPAEVEMAINAMVEKAIDRMVGSLPCNCKISSEGHEEMGHILGVIEDVGGPEVLRDNHKYLLGVRGYSTKIADYILRTTIGLLVVAIFGAIVAGIVSKIKG